jgi:hypothetical protein
MNNGYKKVNQNMEKDEPYSQRAKPKIVHLQGKSVKIGMYVVNLYRI